MQLGELAGDRYPGPIYSQAPRNVYWEMTIACDLACKHCRADAIHVRDPLDASFRWRRPPRPDGPGGRAGPRRY
jgi:hypothetical protein